MQRLWRSDDGIRKKGTRYVTGILKCILVGNGWVDGQVRVDGCAVLSWGTHEQARTRNSRHSHQLLCRRQQRGKRSNKKVFLQKYCLWLGLGPNVQRVHTLVKRLCNIMALTASHELACLVLGVLIKVKNGAKNGWQASGSHPPPFQSLSWTGCCIPGKHQFLHEFYLRIYHTGIMEDHRKQDQLMLVKTGKYTGFCVFYNRSF